MTSRNISNQKSVIEMVRYCEVLVFLISHLNLYCLCVFVDVTLSCWWTLSFPLKKINTNNKNNKIIKFRRKKTFVFVFPISHLKLRIQFLTTLYILYCQSISY